MKKLGLGIVGLIVAVGVYYFTAGSKQITVEMKSQINQQLATLEAKGFAIEERKSTEKSEHFVLNFNEMGKIASLLTNKGMKITPQDAEVLKGLKIGVDVQYLADAYSAISVDMYPVTLPTALTAAKLDEKEQKILSQVQQLLTKKALLMHVDVNKLGTGFKGHMKDINEVLKVGGKDVKLSMHALNFNGELKENTLSSVEQTLKSFTMSPADNIIIQLNDLRSKYVITGKSKYEYATDYSIDEVKLKADKNFKLRISNLSMNSSSKVVNNLVSATVQTEIHSIQVGDAKKEALLDTIIFDMKTDNLDIEALKKLENIDPDNTQAIQTVLKQLLSKGIRFEIPNFSVKHVSIDNQKMDGFKLKTAFDIAKTFDFAAVQQNPLAALSTINAKLNLNLSNSFFGFVAKQPQAAMAMMFLQPKDVNGNKVYDVELKEGSLKVNGQPMM